MGGKGKGKENTVVVTGLPRSASWQDLKDHMRNAGDVMFADIDQPGVGLVRYADREDAHRAVKDLHRSLFMGTNREQVEIRVRPMEDTPRGRRTRSRSRGRY